MKIIKLAWVGTRTENFQSTVDFFQKSWAFDRSWIFRGFRVLKLPDGYKVEVFGTDSDVNRHFTTGPVAGLLAAAHAGQVLVSAAVVDILGSALPSPLGLRSLGPHRLYEQGRAEEIHQLVLPGLPTDFPPLQTFEGRRDNLPIQLTSFVGRQRELSELKQTLQGSRLVTLTGVGGAGKSRLAVAGAFELRGAFPDGVCLVQLAPLSESDQIASAIASISRDTGGSPSAARRNIDDAAAIQADPDSDR